MITHFAKLARKNFWSWIRKFSLTHRTYLTWRRPAYYLYREWQNLLNGKTVAIHDKLVTETGVVLDTKLTEI